MAYTIPNFKDWTVKAARADCGGHEVTLTVENGSDYSEEKVESAQIKSNSEGSVVGDEVYPGGSVSVIIVPPEGRDA
ncbi:MAG: hypothetical protein NXI31_08450 [bacterium]|nr:hypothetical protein [bacterium]